MDISPPRQFPFCVVWTPIPLITWLLPFVGHMGVCKADGTILDFLGPYYVQVGNLGFGNPTRYLKLDPRVQRSRYRPSSGKPLEEWWDEELDHSAVFFRTLFYNFCGTNCHSFVSFFLNQIDYRGSMGWNSVVLAVLVFFRARHVSLVAATKTWLPFCLIIAVGVYWGGLPFVYTYLSIVGVAVVYFVLYEYALRAQSKLVDRFERMASV